MNVLPFVIVSVTQKDATGSLDRFSSLDSFKSKIRFILFSQTCVISEQSGKAKACTHAHFIKPIRMNTKASVSVVTTRKEMKHIFAANIGAKPFSAS